MDELVKMVSQKTGLSEDKARSAAETVIDYVKAKLPQPLASQVDNVVNKGGGGGMGDIAGKVGGMLGDKGGGMFGDK
jgi:hypothetical protein